MEPTIPKPGSFGEFVLDLRRSLVIASRVPWLIAVELALLLLLAGGNEMAARDPDNPLVGLVVLIATATYLAAIGWLGAQRKIMRAVMLGEPVSLGEVGTLISEQGLRFLKLGLLLAPAIVAYFAVALVFTDDILAENPHLSLTGQIVLAAGSIVVAVALTLVTPSLAFETDRARTAWEKGSARLRRHWRLVKWHAVLPLLVFAVVPILLGLDEPAGRAVAVVLGLGTFVLRGAVVAVHLRIRDQELASLPPPRPVIL